MWKGGTWRFSFKRQDIKTKLGLVFFFSVSADEDTSRQVRNHFWGRSPAWSPRSTQELVWILKLKPKTTYVFPSLSLTTHSHTAVSVLGAPQVPSNDWKDWLWWRADPDPLPSVEPSPWRMVSLELTVPAAAGAGQSEEAGPQSATLSTGTTHFIFSLVFTSWPGHSSSWDVDWKIYWHKWFGI